MAVEVTIKKWGNSKGAIFPKGFLEERGIEENDRILVEVVKKADFSKIFGTLKTKTTGQQFKNMAREGWD